MIGATHYSHRLVIFSLLPLYRNKKKCEVNEWVQCDSLHCRKWRRLPPGFDVSSLSEHWYCTDHPDKNMRSHEIEEEPYEDHVIVKQEVRLTKKRKKDIRTLKNRKCARAQIATYVSCNICWKIFRFVGIILDTLVTAE